MDATLLASILAAGATAIGSVFVAKLNAKHDRQKYYEDKIAGLFEKQEAKIAILQEEVERLTKINLELLEKIMKLEKMEE